VLDIGCGTGLNFAALEDQIGPGGRVIGIDLSPEMLAEAHARTERHDWANVTLIESAIEDAAIPVAADPALLCGVNTTVLPTCHTGSFGAAASSRALIFGSCSITSKGICAPARNS
jgi:SAM-dependent methyltransferase